MANYSCEACGDLRNDAPNVIVNGITATEEASLANNTGLNPSSGNNDCTDLNNLNDCLIGNLEQDIESYDVCEWKPFMKKFLPNIWTVLKGIISAICGIWTNITNLWTKVNSYDERLAAMCALIDALISPPSSRFGTLLNSEGQAHPERRGGSVGTKNGKPIVTPMARSEVDELVWNAQNMGLRLGKQQTSRCSDGACQSYEWISPCIIGYRVNESLTLDVGDVLWSASKAECMSWGMSENLWNAYVVSSWTWTGFGFGGLHKANVWIKLKVNNNRLEMTYQGFVGEDQTTSGRVFTEQTEPLRRYIYSC